jgi:2-desacetyl-2-hydroxyethyl bacteriochlorophyllide A dehydrogenase
VNDGISDLHAAMLEPATVAVHAVRRTEVRPGDSVVVIGGGPIGLLVMQCARAAGAGTVILLEPQQSRRDLGKVLGADLTIDPAAEAAVERVNAHIGAAGADVVFECAGIPATVEQAVELARRGGIVSLIGVPNAPSQINAATWLVKEIRLTASLGYLREEFAVTQALVADGRIQLGPMHTSTVSLGAITEAFDKLATEPEEVKVLVDPNL